MLSIPVHQDVVDHPIACSVCNSDAAVIFFERLPAPQPLIAHLRKKFARCQEHLPADASVIR